MANITKLPDEWRSSLDGLIRCCTENDCNIRATHTHANQLEAALPKWIKITDNPKTWPPVGEFIGCMTGEANAFYYGHVFLERTVTWDVDFHVYTHWRPLCDLDYPPENNHEPTI